MTAVSLPLALIVAVARNGVIGADNGMPWRLPTDLRHFKALTLGKPVLMGRRTWDSIGRPLPGRHLIVVSRDPRFAPDGAEVAATLDAAIARGTAVGRASGVSEIMVAGGGTLYRALIDRAQRLYVTRIAADPAGDTTFPTIDPAHWSETAREVPPRAPADTADVAFLTYTRL